VESSWFIRLSVKDEPGVLASIAGLFGEQNVSIESVIQEGRGDNAELVLVTHEATEENLTTAINDIANLESVSSVTSTIRVYS
jgi:homoserine dehydrogenase